LALAADVTYKYRGILVQLEWVSLQKKYTDAGRPAHAEFLAPVSAGFSADFFAWAGYGLVAYTLPWYALTPYFMLQHSREVLVGNVPDLILDAILTQAGITLHPIDAVTFKAITYLRASMVDNSVQVLSIDGVAPRHAGYALPELNFAVPV
jgi:hypothetical protein